MMKIRTQVATMAKKPRMTMTAIAQSGKSEALLSFWVLPGLPGLFPVAEGSTPLGSPFSPTPVPEGSVGEEGEPESVDEGLGEAVDEASMIDLGRSVWTALKTA